MLGIPGLESGHPRQNLLKTGLESFKHLTRQFLGTEAQEFRLLVRKEVYPYEYMDSSAVGCKYYVCHFLYERH